MKALLKNLSEFNKICPPVKKDSTNPFFKSSYAKLDAIQMHIQPYLQKCGLVVTQVNMSIEGLAYVKSTVWDLSGEYLDSIFPIIVSKNTPQEYGSAVSYAKRYSISGLLNLVIEDEDDDGHAASSGNKLNEAINKINQATTKEELTQIRTNTPSNIVSNSLFIKAGQDRFAQISKNDK